MTQNRFERQPGEPRFVGDEGIDMVGRLNEILADLMEKFTIYMRADTSELHELDAEEAELVVQSDGEHLYVGRKTIDDPKNLSILEVGIYTGRILALDWAIKIKVTSAERKDDEMSNKLRCYLGNKFRIDPEAALQYMEAFIKARSDPDDVDGGYDPDEAIDWVVDHIDEIKENPRKYAPEPARATEYFAACVEQIRQIIENHRFIKETFEIVYRPLEKLARKLSVFQPELPEEEKEAMRESGMDDEEIDVMLKGAQQEHRYRCQVFEIYQKLAREILEG